VAVLGKTERMLTVGFGASRYEEADSVDETAIRPSAVLPLRYYGQVAGRRSTAATDEQGKLLVDIVGMTLALALRIMAMHEDARLENPRCFASSCGVAWNGPNGVRQDALVGFAAQVQKPHPSTYTQHHRRRHTPTSQ
jgi:hypothetical protein